jgi:hypothetical protein
MIHTLIDDNLMETCNFNETLRCIQIGLLCLQHHPDDRPNMTSVVVMLKSNNAIPQPQEPGYLLKTAPIERELFSSDGETSSSINQVTISILDVR